MTKTWIVTVAQSGNQYRYWTQYHAEQFARAMQMKGVEVSVRMKVAAISKATGGREWLFMK